MPRVCPRSSNLTLKQQSDSGFNFEIRSRPIPQLRPWEVLVELSATGICGTDLSLAANHLGPARYIDSTLILGADCSSFPRLSLNSNLHELTFMKSNSHVDVPKAVGAVSLLVTDLCNLTMQFPVLEYSATVPVTYKLTNRSLARKVIRIAFHWLEEKIESERILNPILLFSF